MFLGPRPEILTARRQSLRVHSRPPRDDARSSRLRFDARWLALCKLECMSNAPVTARTDADRKREPVKPGKPTHPANEKKQHDPRQAPTKYERPAHAPTDPIEEPSSRVKKSR